MKRVNGDRLVAQRGSYVLNSSSHFGGIMKSLDDQRKRKDKSLCDTTLVVDGNSLMAHKSVLSACSGYFKKRFGAETKQSETECGEHSSKKRKRTQFGDLPYVITLPGLPLKPFAQVLEYMYTSRLHITKDSAYKILLVSCMLQVDRLTNTCLAVFKREKTWATDGFTLASGDVIRVNSNLIKLKSNHQAEIQSAKTKTMKVKSKPGTGNNNTETKIIADKVVDGQPTTTEFSSPPPIERAEIHHKPTITEYKAKAHIIQTTSSFPSSRSLAASPGVMQPTVTSRIDVQAPERPCVAGRTSGLDKRRSRTVSEGPPAGRANNACLRPRFRAKALVGLDFESASGKKESGERPKKRKISHGVFVRRQRQERSSSDAELHQKSQLLDSARTPSAGQRVGSENAIDNAALLSYFNPQLGGLAYPFSFDPTYISMLMEAYSGRQPVYNHVGTFSPHLMRERSVNSPLLTDLGVFVHQPPLPTAYPHLLTQPAKETKPPMLHPLVNPASPMKRPASFDTGKEYYHDYHPASVAKSFGDLGYDSPPPAEIAQSPVSSQQVKSHHPDISYIKHLRKRKLLSAVHSSGTDTESAGCASDSGANHSCFSNAIQDLSVASMPSVHVMAPVVNDVVAMRRCDSNPVSTADLKMHQQCVV